MKLAVLEPRPGTRAAEVIDHDSGVVADLAAIDTQGRVLVYYEGNRYGAVNLQTKAERVLCAAGRLRATYPTVAKALFQLDDFDLVANLEY